ncbi:MAG TPA: S49 family peptidase [Beijerinckiaceae bacterium]|nr:S49 family peptidase [Beijerinckiaceae bacterium]
MPNILKATADAFGPLLPARWRSDIPVVPIVRFSGVIGAAVPLRPGLGLATTAKMLERAFATRNARAVAMVINSPGGSPAQSHLILQRIRQLATEKKLPVFAFIEDAGASGGYMLACAGDEIFADPSSLVGSIGVVAAGFGFDKLLDRFGVERRLHTAGTSKAMLDPFSPERPEDVARLKGIQAQIHAMFVALVESRRAGRLKGDREALFSGAVWAGAEAQGLGLVDGLGDLGAVLRERFGEKVRLKPVAVARPGLLARVLGRREPTIEDGSAGAGLIDPGAVIAAIEERAAWARLGL